MVHVCKDGDSSDEENAAPTLDLPVKAIHAHFVEEVPEEEEVVEEDLDDLEEPPREIQQYKWYSLAFRDFALEEFVTAYFVSPAVLLCIRFVCWFYASVVIINSWVNATDKWWLYLTNLSYFGLWVYFSMAVYYSFVFNVAQNYTDGFGSRKRTKPVSLYRALVESKFSHAIMKLHWLNYELLVVLHIFVPIGYWGLLKPNKFDPYNVWLNISVHGIDLVLIFAEFLFARVRLLPMHGLFHASLCLAYMCYAWVYYGASADWIYPFLDLTKTSAKMMYPLLFVGVLVLFVICALGHKGRDVIGRAFIYAMKLPGPDKNLEGSDVAVASDLQMVAITPADSHLHRLPYALPEEAGEEGGEAKQPGVVGAEIVVVAESG